jgi:hypothetical protein
MYGKVLPGDIFVNVSMERHYYHILSNVHSKEEHHSFPKLNLARGDETNKNKKSCRIGR